LGDQVRGTAMASMRKWRFGLSGLQEKAQRNQSIQNINEE